MAVLKVVKYPDRVLSTKASDLEKITADDKKLIRDMIDTMHAESGVGLAANQVGVLKQIFVASADQVKGKEMAFINPKIVKKEGAIKEFEGCLSVPELYEPVGRAKRVTLKAMTPDGKSVQIKAEGLLARIFQHEVDHLNGFLFIDRLGFLKKRLAKRKLSRRKS